MPSGEEERKPSASPEPTDCRFSFTPLWIEVKPGLRHAHCCIGTRFYAYSGLVAALGCARAAGLSWHTCKILRWMELETLFTLRNPIFDAKCVLVLMWCFAHASW